MSQANPMFNSKISPATRQSKGRDDPAEGYALDHSLRLTPVQEELRKVTDQHSHGRMLGAAEELQLLANLVKLIKGKKTLDVGVFTGYSALSIALVLPPDGRVVALDVNEEWASIGKPFWEKAGVTDKIDLRIAPAKESLEKLLQEGEAGTFDFAFIDADKSSYDTYYELCLELIRPGGIIALDNVIFGGRVYDDSVNDEYTVAIRALNKKLRDDPRVDISMLCMGDGVTIAIKQ